ITVNSYSVQNSTTVTANITIASNATLSARDVIITNADTQTGTLAGAFTITSGAPVPVSISPSPITPCGTFNVTVTGTNFTPLVTQNFIAFSSSFYDSFVSGTPTLDFGAGQYGALSHGVSVGGNGTA